MSSNSPDARVATLPEEATTSENVIAIHQNKLLVPVRDIECGKRIAAWLKSNPHLNKAQLMLVHITEPQWFDIPYSGFQALQLIQEHGLKNLCKQQMLQGVATTLQLTFPELRVSYSVREGSDRADAITELGKEWNADCIMVFSKPKRLLPFPFDNRLTRKIMAKADRTVQVIQKTEKPPQIAFPAVECSAY